MEPLGGTEAPTSTSVHTLQLSGLVSGLSVRAERQEACGLVLAAVGG